MKILIIGFAKIKYMPYLNLYLDNIDAEKNEVHLMYWDRDGSPDKVLPTGIKKHVFSMPMADELPKVKKLSAFAAFAMHAKKLIKKERFDFLIVLTSIPAVLLSDVLLREYKGRYIYDYRDYTFENIGIYRKRVAQLVENSCFTVYSSEKHLKFLPKSEKLHIAHNFIKASLDYRGIKTAVKNREEPIRISYWGIVRNEEFNKQVIETLGNDSRFELSFYGKKQQTSENLEKYCREKSFKNIKFYGEYQEEERYEFVKNTDILYNLYNITGTEGMAMGNKFFDGVIFYLPQLCTKGSYMGEMAEKYGVGRAFDINSEEFADRVYSYYNSIDESAFRKNCDALMKKVTEDYSTVAELIRKSCESKN